MNKSDQAMDRAPEDSSSASTAPETIATTSATTQDVPAFGWSAYAERINGRFAMIGFLAVVLTEALSADTFLHWSGLIP